MGKMRYFKFPQYGDRFGELNSKPNGAEVNKKDARKKCFLRRRSGTDKEGTHIYEGERLCFYDPTANPPTFKDNETREDALCAVAHAIAAEDCGTHSTVWCLLQQNRIIEIDEKRYKELVGESEGEAKQAAMAEAYMEKKAEAHAAGKVPPPPPKSLK